MSSDSLMFVSQNDSDSKSINIALFHHIRKVMFSVVSVSSQGGRTGSHVTINHDALDLTVQDPSPALALACSDIRPHCTQTHLQTWNLTVHRPHSSDIWRPFQSCSLEPLLVLTSGRKWVVRILLECFLV